MSGVKVQESFLKGVKDDLKIVVDLVLTPIGLFNNQDIHIIYIVDHKNGGSEEQYPESFIYIEPDSKGFCKV